MEKLITQGQAVELRKLPIGTPFRVDGVRGLAAKLIGVNYCAATVELKGNKIYTIHAHDEVTGEPKEVKFTGPRRALWAPGTRVVEISQQELELSKCEGRDNVGQTELEETMATRKKTTKDRIKDATKKATKATKIPAKKASKNKVKDTNPPETNDSEFPYSMQELHRRSSVSVLTLRKYVSRPELLKEIPHDQNARGHMMFNDASVKAVVAIKERNQAAVGTKG